MPAKTKGELGAEFDKKAAKLTAELQIWFEKEASSIDGKIESAAPAGTGGSIVTVRTPIDSKRVLDTTLITEEVLGIELPPEIIKPGGYETFDEMVSDLVPKLRLVFTGELKVKQRKREDAKA